MKKKEFVGAMVLAVMPVISMAAAPKPIAVPDARSQEPSAGLKGAYADAYYIPTASLDGGNASDDGDGFGVHGMLPLGTSAPLFLNGEYQEAKFDKFDVKEKQFRLGLGLQLTPLFGVYAEYASIKFSNTLDGFGVHGRLATQNTSPVNFFADLGYLRLQNNKNPNDAEGLEYTIGGSYRINPQLSGFADYRSTKLSTNNFPDLTISDLRLGVRFDINP